MSVTWKEPWTEKYRPRTLGDIVGNEDTMSILKQYVLDRNVGNLLFIGPPGTAKTTAAWAIANDLGIEAEELNASDERGIGVVRGFVKEYAQSFALDGEPKLMILDEADGITKDAQRALRRIMEKNIQQCKFIMTANEMGRIIPPLQSRTSILYFNSIDVPQLTMLCVSVLQKENLLHLIRPEMVKLICSKVEGDARFALNTVQDIAQLAVRGTLITEDLVNKVVSSTIPTYENVETCLLMAIQGNVSESIGMLFRLTNNYSANGFYNMCRKCITSNRFSEVDKAIIARAMSRIRQDFGVTVTDLMGLMGTLYIDSLTVNGGQTKEAPAVATAPSFGTIVTEDPYKRDVF